MGFGMAVASGGPYQTWNWVIGSPGQWVIRPGHRVIGSFSTGVRPDFFRFSKKAQDKDIYFCENPSNLIEILTFNKWSSKFYSPEACKRQTAIKTGKPLAHCPKCDPVPCLQQSAPRSRQITTPAPHHSVFYRPDALPASQPTASKHWRQNKTKGMTDLINLL